jgi:hypothetical protein
MINSILNRHTDPVHLYNIKTDNSVITDPIEILQHVQQHFQHWTQHQPINTTIFNQYWTEEYQPKQSINCNWYAPLLKPISTEEIMQTMQQLPNNKACGPLGISYEMLKHCSSSMLQAIIQLFNKCLNTNMIPKQ